MIQGPCKDCAERFIGCHAQCLKYIDYRQKLDVEKNKVQEKKDKDYDERRYIIQSVRRMKAHQNRRK